MFSPEKSPTSSFPYRIEGQIGSGSMGVVFRAKEVQLDRTVAIKVLRQSVLEEEPQSVQDEMRSRFLQEARAAAALSHPGVTTVFRVGEEDGLPYMVMEWLDGQTLEAILEEHRRINILEACRLVVSLLETLQVAHQNGVVHRDIKPSNLVLLDDGRLKVTDFGIALLQGRELVKTQAGVVLATPKFAAPEQLRGIEVDGRADLFATGVLLYRMITGHYPFEGKNFMDLATTILQTEPAPMREYVPGLPAQLEASIRVALRKDRENRYAQASDMAEAIRPFSVNNEDGTGTVRIDQLPPELADQGTSTTSPAPVIQNAPSNPALALAALVASWPGSILDRQPTQSLLDGLLDKPLHTHAFSGAAMVADSCLLICNGTLVGAIHRQSGEQGDVVIDNLPAVTTPSLHPLPTEFPERLVSLLSSLLHPPKQLHSDLDSSFINVPSLAGRLLEQQFDGLLRVVRGQAIGFLFFDQGKNVLGLFSEGWDNAPIDQHWQNWMAKVQVRASVEEKQSRPLNLWFRRSLRDFALTVQVVEGQDAKDQETNLEISTSSRIRQLFQSGRSNPVATGQLVLRVASTPQGIPVGSSSTSSYLESPAFRFLNWALGQLPLFLEERKKTGAWKYLGEWLSLVRQAKLHHNLPRPGSRDADNFDIVTLDDDDKVLHLGHYISHPTADQFYDYVERVIAAKKARIKSGDIGGVFLIASKLSDELLAAYSERIQGTTGIFGFEDSFTGYAGFVRIGARRGFHLMLVEDKASGYEPILPN